MKAFVRKNRCQRCRLLVEKCICQKLVRIDSSLQINLLLHAKEMGRVSNSGLIATRVISSIAETHYGTEDYRFRPEDIYKPNMENLVLYPEASKSLESYKKDGLDPTRLNLIVPDGNWPQANSMTKKLVITGKYKPVKLGHPVGGRYWLRLDHNHEAGISTLEAIATAFEVFGLISESNKLREALEHFVHQSLIIRGKSDLSEQYFGTSTYLS